MTSFLELVADVVLGVRCPRHHKHRMPCEACQLEAHLRSQSTSRTMIRGGEDGLR